MQVAQTGVAEFRTPRWATAKVVADCLNVHTETVYRWTRQGLIPCVHVGARTLRFDLHAVRAALTSTRGG